MRRRRELFAFGAVTAGACLTALLFGAVIAPADAVQGNAQRLMYLHVPAAWTAYLSFLVVLLASLGVLLSRSLSASRVARAAAEVGLALTALTLATGSLWGGLTWGTWWVWDARVLSTVAMGLVYSIYLAARSLANEEGGAPGVAVIGVLGFAIVPVVHFSVLWWRTLHQPPTILAPQLNPPMDAIMLFTLCAAVVAFTMLALMVISLRSRWLAERSAGVNEDSALLHDPTSGRVLQ